jgi:hypothetical protein
MTTPNTKAFILTGLAAGLLTSAPLGAEDGSSKLRFGIEGSFAAPMSGASKIASNGFGAGMFLDNEFDWVTKRLGRAMRSSLGLSLDYISLGEKKWEGGIIPGSEIATSMENITLQAYSRDSIFLSGDSGLYYFIGLGCGYVTIDNSSGANSSSFAVMFTWGFDYSFNRNVGLLARYSGSMGGNKWHGLDKSLLRRHIEYFQFGAQYRF